MAEPLTLTICLKYKQLRTCVNKCTDGSNYTTEVSQGLFTYIIDSLNIYGRPLHFGTAPGTMGHNSKTVDKVPASMETVL